METGGVATTSNGPARPTARAGVADGVDAAAVLPGPVTLLGLALAYFTGQLLVRLWTSSALELDEAEQLLLTQELAWGYGPHGPLYTWLLAVAFRLVGVTPLALALLKNALLLAAYVCVYRSARLATGSRDHAALAAVTLLFVPQVAWESQRDLTHTVLAVTAAAATLLVVLRLGEAPTTGSYVALGLVASAGLLAKASYAAFLAGLALSALTLPRYRARLLDPRGLLAAVVVAALLAPHARFLLEHAGRLTPAALDPGPGGAPLARRLAGVVDLGRALLTLAAVPVGVVLALGRPERAATPGPRPLPDPARLLTRTVLVAIALDAVVILALGRSVVRSRWMQPIVVVLPVLLAAALHGRLDVRRRRRLFRAGLLAAVGLLVGMAAHPWLLGLRGEASRIDAPFPRLAGDLGRMAGRADLVVAENRWLGGNLRLQLPDKAVAVPEWPGAAARRPGPCLLVWHAGAEAGPPPELVAFAGADGRGPWSLLAAPYRFHRGPQFRLGVLLSECRTGPPASAR